MPDPMVTVELTWTEARALAYAASIGLERDNWPSPAYRAHGQRARQILVDLTMKSEAQHLSPRPS